nr:MAG TPA: hypothetical protein [Caudoviricetes sp.]
MQGFLFFYKKIFAGNKNLSIFAECYQVLNLYKISKNFNNLIRKGVEYQ